jgi:hypothetical protein
MGFKSGEYFGKKKSLAPAEAHDFASMAAEIVHHHDVAGTKRREKDLFDIEAEAVAVDWTFKEPWRLDPVMAQSCQERHGLPAAVRNLGRQPLAAWRPSPQCRHIGPGPGLVDEDQTFRLDAILIFDPLGSPPCDVVTIAFASHQAFF